MFASCSLPADADVNRFAAEIRIRSSKAGKSIPAQRAESDNGSKGSMLGVTLASMKKKVPPGERRTSKRA
jgi:hypothetical protein